MHNAHRELLQTDSYVVLRKQLDVIEKHVANARDMDITKPGLVAVRVVGSDDDLHIDNQYP